VTPVAAMVTPDSGITLSFATTGDRSVADRGKRRLLGGAWLDTPPLVRKHSVGACACPARTEVGGVVLGPPVGDEGLSLEQGVELLDGQQFPRMRKP
jgi:hypothetical protein